jgi:hypothetical protein
MLSLASGVGPSSKVSATSGRSVSTLSTNRPKSWNPRALETSQPA